jgi:hypothetical protein
VLLIIITRHLIFSGTANISEIETTEIEVFPGARASITGIRPVVDAEATVTIKTRERLADNPTESTTSTMKDSGINPVRQSGRYFRANVKIPSGTIFNHGQGVDITAVKSGIR